MLKTQLPQAKAESPDVLESVCSLANCARLIVILRKVGDPLGIVLLRCDKSSYTFRVVGSLRICVFIPFPQQTVRIARAIGVVANYEPIKLGLSGCLQPILSLG